MVEDSRILAAEARMRGKMRHLLVVEPFVAEVQRRDRAVLHDLRCERLEARLLQRRVGNDRRVAVMVGGVCRRHCKMALAVLKNTQGILLKSSSTRD